MTLPLQSSTEHFGLRLGLFYAAYFLFGGVQLPFFPVFLQARGLEAGMIGVVIAAPMLLRIVATPVIAHQADRRQALKATLLIASVVAALAMIAVGLADSALAILVAYAIAAAAFSPVLPLTDAYALSGLTARGKPYGPVRLWGSVAFIAGNVGAGLLLAMIAPRHLIWLIVLPLVLAVAAAAALVPLSAGPKAAESAEAAARGSPLSLIRHRTLLAVALASAMVQGSHAMYYGFSTLDWRAAGYDGLSIGTLWGLGVAAEIVLFALSGRLPASLAPTTLMMLGAAGGCLRWTAMAFDPPAAALPFLQLLHAASFGATHLSVMGFLARAVPRQSAASAQGLIATLSGIVNAAATTLSGIAYAASGSLAYLLMAAMTLIGLLSALAASRFGRAAPDY